MSTKSRYSGTRESRSKNFSCCGQMVLHGAERHLDTTSSGRVHSYQLPSVINVFDWRRIFTVQFSSCRLTFQFEKQLFK